MKKHARRLINIMISFILCLVMYSCGEDSSADDPTLFITDDYVTPQISSISPLDGSSDVSADTDLSVVFSEQMDPLTITANTISKSCAATLQLSADDFTTCIQMSENPAISNSFRTFTVSPLKKLEPATSYKFKVTTEARDQAGNSTSSDYITKSGFVTKAAGSK